MSKRECRVRDGRSVKVEDWSERSEEYESGSGGVVGRGGGVRCKECRVVGSERGETRGEE